ncbi:hypothetical protein Aph01nite_01870 [Acrocarpospora phusangensis]|uniref:Uncharacterized protein n=2 Tax=Acrocarpospora phusangensis TaxID=1070424 RepID=A0A919Q3Z0_9ACTN|nr:hypothetical protein Aph01nite_01870 [Acrocarpospora phusangensis]
MPQAPQKTPVTLTITLIGALVVALANLVNGVIYLVSGEDLLIEQAKSLGLSEELVQLALESVDTSIVTTRGVIFLVTGLIVGLLALALRSAATWARVVLTLFALGSLLTMLIALNDNLSSLIVLLAFASGLAALTVLITIWLPPTNRYAKYRKMSGA